MGYCQIRNKVIKSLEVFIFSHAGQFSNPRLMEERHLIQVAISDHSRCPPVLDCLRILGSSDQLILNVD